MPGTVNFQRVFAASPGKVFRAFTDAAAMAQWLPPYGFTCTVHELDPREGGKHRASFTNFTTGNSHSFGGEYLVCPESGCVIRTGLMIRASPAK